MSQRLTVDIGGTFVDAVSYDAESGVSLEKAPTTPNEPVEGVFEAVESLPSQLSQTEEFVHGTTLGLNAVLEREGATTGIITTEGFRDVYEIGRLTPPRSDMYNVRFAGRELLVPRRRRIGVPGRVDEAGEIIEPLDEDAVKQALRILVEERGVDSIAVCFLHSYQNQDHEQRVGEIIEEEYPEVSVSLSSDISRELREYERTSTTVLDAYIKPVFKSYVDNLESSLAKRGFEQAFFITRSGGGAFSAQNATKAPVETVLSGPAGGLIGAAHIGDLIDRDQLISVDMGGTSLDSCVIRNGSPALSYEASLEAFPIQIPVYDIRTVGAGGGSIAWLDGSLLKVGPQSAGSDPGPICYGRGGTDPTVTDAALALGYLDPNSFLGGEMTLDIDRTIEGIRDSIAEPLDQSVQEASSGVFRVMTADTVGTLREITVEKGLDPREFSIIAYGGAGPMAIPTLARELGVEEVVIPRLPAVFSAWGMLMTDVVYNSTESFIVTLQNTSLNKLSSVFEKLESSGADQLSEEGFSDDAHRFNRSAEMRYYGQEHSVDVDAGNLDSLEDLRDRFEAEHESRYGHSMDDPVELVYLRSRAIGVLNKPDIASRSTKNRTEGLSRGTRDAYCFAQDKQTTFDVYQRSEFASGQTLDGPAIIQEPTTTTVFHSDQKAEINEHGCIVIRGGGDTV